MPLSCSETASPAGKLRLFANPSALVAILWQRERPNRVKLSAAAFDPQQPILKETERQLVEYFSGQRSEFDLPLRPGGSDFEQKVWRALRAIPFGQTRTYSDLAIAIGSPKAARAVGAAIGRNPLSIVVPCHRVVGANGSLTGFAGGLAAKATLLSLEAKIVASDDRTDKENRHRFGQTKLTSTQTTN